MLKNSIAIVGLGLLGLLAAFPVAAQVPATLVLQSGERVSGELVDLSGVGFTLRVNGQDRDIEAGQVAAVDFAGTVQTVGLKARIHAGPVVVLRSGEVIDGTLYDIGGTRPLRITVNTPGGQREFTSNEVAQILTGAGAATHQVTSAAGQEVAPGDYRVDANRPWTDTGVDVRRGERVIFNPTGHINLAEGISSGVNGTTAVSSANYPVRQAPAGMLIARVGNGAPFAIGSQTEMVMPAAGRLFFGVNDDHFGDNSGFFSVGVARAPATRRR